MAGMMPLAGMHVADNIATPLPDCKSQSHQEKKKQILPKHKLLKNKKTKKLEHMRNMYAYVTVSIVTKAVLLTEDSASCPNF